MNGMCGLHKGSFSLAVLLILAAVGGASDLPDHVVLYYDFDEENIETVPDRSVYQNDAAIEGYARWEDSQYGLAMLLDGTQVAATAPASESLTSLKAPMTVGALFQPSSIPDGYRKMMGMYGTPGNRSTGWAYEFNGKAFDFVLFGKKNFWGPDLVLGEWIYIITVFDRDTVVLYVNGEPAYTIDSEGLDTDVSQSPGFWLGAEAGILGTQPVDVVVDEVWISNKALSADEVDRVMQGQWRPDLHLASNPVPEDEATEVLRDTTLGWTPGITAQDHRVFLGTDFEDVNDASLTDALGLRIAQRTSENEFDPGRLDFETQYFWRVDEVNGAPDFTAFKGKVWSFTTEQIAYPVVPAAATASSVHLATMGPEKTIDGSGLNAMDQHDTSADHMWLAATTDTERWIQYEFAQTQKLHAMWVWNSNQLFESLLGVGVRDVTVDTSTDGAAWTALADVPEFAQAPGLANYAHNTVVDFGGTAARYVRLTVNTNWSMLPQTGLSEVRFFAMPVRAADPQPADASAVDNLELTLQWRPGRDVAMHDVYLGTDPDALALIGTTSATTADAGTLDLATTYYWRVDEVNDAEAIQTWDGALWSFATPPFVVVDDFESYTDDIQAGETIWQAWGDGLEATGNGSRVGYLESPFAEIAIVHGGRQSMPLFYDNVGDASYSEATLTLDEGRDWTRSGIGTLSLSFHGTAGNAGQLYVKINGVKIAYNGDTADLAEATWQSWDIDLSGVDASLNRVTSLAVGIDGAGAYGIVYIDDIRLYP